MFFCVQAIEYTLANESFFTAYWTKNYPAYVLSIITQTANIDPTVVEEWYHFAEHKTIFSCSLPAIIMVSISTLAYWSDQAAVISCPGHLQDPAHRLYTELARVLPDKPIDHFGVLEKMAMAFFKNVTFLLGKRQFLFQAAVFLQLVARSQFSLAGEGSIAKVRSLSAPPAQHIDANSKIPCHLAYCFVASISSVLPHFA